MLNRCWIGRPEAQSNVCGADTTAIRRMPSPGLAGRRGALRRYHHGDCCVGAVIARLWLARTPEGTLCIAQGRAEAANAPQSCRASTAWWAGCDCFRAHGDGGQYDARVPICHSPAWTRDECPAD